MVFGQILGGIASSLLGGGGGSSSPAVASSPAGVPPELSAALNGIGQSFSTAVKPIEEAVNGGNLDAALFESLEMYGLDAAAFGITPGMTA